MVKAPVNFNILLRQINAIRAATHRPTIAEIPKGTPTDNFDCPIARALANGWNVEVGANVIDLYRGHGCKPASEVAADLRKAGFKVNYEENDGISFVPSATMQNFIRRFDNEEFKELIEGA